MTNILLHANASHNSDPTVKIQCLAVLGINCKL